MDYSIRMLQYNDRTPTQTPFGVMARTYVGRLTAIYLIWRDMILCCLVVDDACEPVGRAFRVNAAPGDDCMDLAEKIIVKAPIDPKLRAFHLWLWKPSDELKLAVSPLESLNSNLKQLHLDRESGKETNNKAFLPSPSQKISKVFNKELEEDCVHILVQLPVETIRSRGANKRFRDEASDILKRLKAKKARVPFHHSVTFMLYLTGHLTRRRRSLSLTMSMTT
ncbi:hypothetical protein K439DRAFT_1000455 [Ramaria rubella]|nr:hypothetical protein K439DRAFT_1000455 [Ramaria rubella]